MRMPGQRANEPGGGAMKIECRYAQVSDTSHGCHHEKLVTIVDDGWRMIECASCKKRWDSETGRKPTAAEAQLREVEAQNDALVEDICQLLRQQTSRTLEMVERIDAYRARWKGER
jgi:hypothetical protein